MSVAGQLPEKMAATFELKTSQMSKSVKATLNFDLEATSIAVTVASPYEMLQSFELTASLMPRLHLLIKYNGKTIINVYGNANFQSWKVHNFEVTMTYPFWNEYMHLKVCKARVIMSLNVFLFMMQFLVKYFYLTG